MFDVAFVFHRVQVFP